MKPGSPFWRQSLVGVQVVSLEKTPDGLIVGLETERRQNACPNCDSVSTINYGRMSLRVRDLTLDGTLLNLDIKRARMRCNECLKTFHEKVVGVSEKHRSTERLVEMIAKLALEQPLRTLSREYGIDEKTVRAIFNERLLALRAISRPHSPTAAVLWLPAFQRLQRSAWVNPCECTLIRMDPDAVTATVLSAVSELADSGTEIVYLPPDPAIIGALKQQKRVRFRLHGSSLRDACRRYTQLSSPAKSIADYLEHLNRFIAAGSPEQATLYWADLQDPPAGIRDKMVPLLLAVKMMGQNAFDGMQLADAPSDRQMAQLDTFLAHGFGRWSYNVMLAVMLYDRRLHKMRRTYADQTGTLPSLEYQKTNFGTELTKLITRFKSMLEVTATNSLAG